MTHYGEMTSLVTNGRQTKTAVALAVESDRLSDVMDHLPDTPVLVNLSHFSSDWIGESEKAIRDALAVIPPNSTVAFTNLFQAIQPGEDRGRRNLAITAILCEYLSDRKKANINLFLATSQEWTVIQAFYPQLIARLIFVNPGK